MKKIYVLKGLSILVIVFMFSACKKDSSSPSTAGTQLSFAVSADNSNSLVSAADNSATGTASIAWKSGIANIAAFKLEAKRKNTEIEIKSKSLLNVDLFAPIPAVISTAIDTGTYREIEIKVLLVKPSSGTIPLTLKGSYTSQTGTVTPVEFDFNDDAEIKVEAEDVTIDGKTDVATSIKLHLNKLISGMAAAKLDAATLTGGTIVISSDVNTDIYNFIKANLALSCSGEGFEHHGKGEGKNHN